MSALTVLTATIGAVLLGLTGHTTLAASVAAIGGGVGIAGSIHITINIRR